MCSFSIWDIDTTILLSYSHQDHRYDTESYVESEVESEDFSDSESEVLKCTDR